MTYYQLKCYITEEFYEFIVVDNYTFGQAAARCLYESWRQISNGGVEALTVYSTVLSRIAFHSPESLLRFHEEMQEMNRLFTAEICSEFSEDELEDLTYDVNFVNQKRNL